MSVPVRHAFLLALAYFYPYLVYSQVTSWNPAEIDRVIEAIRACRDQPAVNLAIVQLNDHGGVRKAYSTATGRVDPSCQGAACVGPTSSTRFCIGSITKQFTAGLLGTLLDKFPKFQDSKWDTKLQEILPGDSGKFFDGESPADLVTIKDLLAHRMGIPAPIFPQMVLLNRSRTDIAKYAA